MFAPITSQIYMVSPGEGGSFPNSFSFYIKDEINTLIDTPFAVWYDSFAANLGERPVDFILSTHYHRDHTGCNHLFPQARIWAHPEDIPAMVSLQSFRDYYGLDEYGSPELTSTLLTWLNWHPSPVHGHLEDNQLISLGDIDLVVVHTPGHTPGHCSFYYEKQRILFSGDIDLTGFGPWYGNVNSDVDHLLQSIQRLIDLNPQAICSGHKGFIDRNIRTQLTKYMDRVLDKEAAILKSLRQPLTLDELTQRKIIYGRWGKPVEQFYFFEKLSIMAHLKRLTQLHQVELINGKYRTIEQTTPQCARL